MAKRYVVRDGRIYARVTYLDSTGKERQLWRRAQSKSEAKELARDLAQNIRKFGTEALEHQLTLSEYLDKWLKSLRLSKRTHTAYETVLRLYVRPLLGGKKVTGIRPLDVQDVIDDLNQRGLSPKTVREAHMVLSRSLKQAVRWRLITFNPAQDAAQRSEARDRGKQPESRPHAEPLSRAASEKETSRLLARMEVAREQLAHLIRTDAPDAQIKSCARIAQDLSAVFQKTLAAREEIGREKLPQVVYTTEEWKQLKEYRESSGVPVKDDHAAARLQATCVLAGAEMKNGHEKADAFQASYHLWKFDVEGWDRRLSLVDVEKAIKAKAEERLKLYNFLRPSKRDEIQGQIDYLREVKKDVQKQLSVKELSIDKSVGAAEVRYQIASKQVEQTQKARALEGREMPTPAHTKDELGRMNEIANRDKNGGLLLYVWDQVKDRVLAKSGPEDLARVKGCAVMAKLDMVREKERLEYAVCFGEFRQLPRKDAQGFLYTQRLRDVSPRSALETIIRHFTDSLEQRKERRDLVDILRKQVTRAQEQAINAREYSAAADKILGAHCRAARASFTHAMPMLNQQQIAEVREFTGKLPPLNQSRMELNEWARQAEQLLHAREAAEAARQAEQARSQDTLNRSIEQSSSQERTRIDRSDRDSYSRGR